MNLVSIYLVSGCLYILVSSVPPHLRQLGDKTVLMRDPQIIYCFISICLSKKTYCQLVRSTTFCCIFMQTYFIFYFMTYGFNQHPVLSLQHWRQARVTDLCWSSSTHPALIALQFPATMTRFLRPAQHPLQFITLTWRTVCLLRLRKNTSPAPITPKSSFLSRSSYLSSSWQTSLHGKSGGRVELLLKC